MTALLLPYPLLPASLEPHDPRASKVATLFITTVRAVAPTLTTEHIGSSSVPGLDGKGIIDLQLAAPATRSLR